jgi:hypothetical protein
MKSKLIFLSGLTAFFLLIISSQTFSSSYGGGDGKKVTVTGEVIDMQCYASGEAHGESHKECATSCIKGGAPIGLLDKDGNVTLLLKDEKNAGDYTKLVDWASQNVKVTGMMYDRGGIKSVVVATVEAAK